MLLWSSNFASGIKIRFKDLSGEILKKKKSNSPGSTDFSLASEAKIQFKKCRDSIKTVVTLVEIQSAREVSHHLTLMDNCQTFYSLFFVFV